MKASQIGSMNWKWVIAMLAWLFVAHAPAMDRWAALAELESNNNDNALGSAGEVSRYQMRPEIWRRYAPTNSDWRNPADALRVAKQIMQGRVAEFQRTFGRPPTDFEFYILWNAPGQIQHAGKAVRARAERFSNLVASTPSVAETPAKKADSSAERR
jgi:hypothetical protein